MSEYAKNIQAVEDMRKKRIELREEGGELMNDKNPCPFCGDESEYLRFLYLCAERANEIWRENEVMKTMIDVYKSMDFVQVVRCRDCKYLCDDGSTWGCGWHCSCLTTNDGTPPDGFCAWGERKQTEPIEVWKQSSPDDVTCYEGKE